VFLANMTEAELDAFLAAGPLRPMTEQSIRNPARLREVIAEVRMKGWAWNDGESEDGIRGVAAPIVDRAGNVRAAINVVGLASRVSLKELRGKHLAVLLRAANDISRALGADERRLQRGSLHQHNRLDRGEPVDIR
jgi:IclR family pca regulon transcriptional regulator